MKPDIFEVELLASNKLEETNINKKINDYHKKDQSVSEASAMHGNKMQSIILDVSKKNKNKNVNNIDEEIVESVSQLESVIKKTIQNTQNINELPIKDEHLELPVDEPDIKSESIITTSDDGSADVLKDNLLTTTISTSLGTETNNRVISESVTPVNHYNLAYSPLEGTFVNQHIYAEVIDSIKGNFISPTETIITLSSAVNKNDENEINFEYNKSTIFTNSTTVPTSDYGHTTTTPVKSKTIITTSGHRKQATLLPTLYSVTTTMSPLVRSDSTYTQSSIIPPSQLLSTFTPTITPIVFKTHINNSTFILDLAKVNASI